jgi:hypothetical protein
MTITVPAPVTETELSNWLTANIGDQIINDYDAATHLLTAFDFAGKEGTSLNNRHQIASLLTTAPTGWGEPFVPLTAPAASQHLLEAFRVTRKPADYERLLVELPMPVVVPRHQCPFCRRFTRASITQVQDHMTRCWQNPSLRCCKTCIHHQDGSHPEDDEACTHTDGPEPEEYQFPVLHCPLWQPKEA